MRDDTVRLAWVVGSFALLAWLSPLSAVLFAASLGACWALRSAGPQGVIAAIVAHGALMAVARSAGSDVGVIGLGALGLQQLVFLREPGRPRLLDTLFTMLFLPRALGGPVWMHITRGRAASDPSGWAWVVLGLVEKVVLADSFAWRADAVFDGHGPVPLIAAWSGLVAFAAQALLDLAGLWHVAAGLALVAGFPLPDGPSRPFAATTLAGFWERWHPSLWAVLAGPNRALPLLASAVLAVLWHAVTPMLALAAASQLVWMGLGRLLPVRPWRPLVWIGALHGLLLARSPSLERAAFVQDGLYGVFGLGGPDAVTLLTLVGGVMVLAFGPPDPTRVFRSRVRGYAPLALGAGVAAVLLCIAQARPFLYFSF
ncbi:MAG: hypothetical protein H6737_13490 [Alphaproteobacteria bacterium]|nr:hypothetical protein [Alphaproteobacteria bacterium]